MKQLCLFISLLWFAGCANTPPVGYFANMDKTKAHAILHMAMKDDNFSLFGVTDSLLKPRTINGYPIDGSAEGWKLHAYAGFTVPVGDTMVTLSYDDRDISGYGYVRFMAKAHQTYDFTFAYNDKTYTFFVHDAQKQLITQQLFQKRQYHYDSDKKQGNALLDAVFAGELATVKTLIKQGIDPNWKEDYAYQALSPLEVAVSEGHEAIVQYLIQAGANVNRPFVLTIAAERGYVKIAKLLLDAGAYVDLYQYPRNSALMAASQQGHQDIVRLLLQHAAYTQSRNAQGFTALDLAQQAGHQDIVKLLTAYKH